MWKNREPSLEHAGSRRQFIQAVVTTAAVVLSGCVGNPFSEPVPQGQLFVENRTNFPKLIELSVTDTQNGERIIHGRYEIPEWHALQFEGVLEPGKTYDIRAFQPDVRGRGQEQLVLNIETCSPGEQGGQMDVSILASSNGPDVLTYGCDKTYNQVQSLTYVEPSEYQVATLTSPVPTPTSTPT